MRSSEIHHKTGQSGQNWTSRHTCYSHATELRIMFERNMPQEMFCLGESLLMQSRPIIISNHVWGGRL